jgi:hypothetical protein
MAQRSQTVISCRVACLDNDDRRTTLEILFRCSSVTLLKFDHISYLEDGINRGLVGWADPEW